MSTLINLTQILGKQIDPTSNYDLPGWLLQWVFLFLIIFILYRIFISYSRLASKHGRTSWHYGIIGLVIFQIGLYVGRRIDAAIISNASINLNTLAQHALGLLGVLLGISASWVVYRILKKKWTSNNR